MDDDVEGDQRQGGNDDEGRDLALAPVPRREALLLGHLLLDVLGALAVDQQPVVVHAIGRAGHEREFVGPRLEAERVDLIGPHDLRARHLVRERLVHGVKKDKVALF